MTQIRQRTLEDFPRRNCSAGNHSILASRRHRISFNQNPILAGSSKTLAASAGDVPAIPN